MVLEMLFKYKRIVMNLGKKNTSGIIDDTRTTLYLKRNRACGLYRHDNECY